MCVHCYAVCYCVGAIVCRSLSSYGAVKYTLVVFSLFGFLFFDLLYIAVTINYCSQCQLLTFYIDNIQDKVRNRKYDNLNLAMKVLLFSYIYIKILCTCMPVCFTSHAWFIISNCFVGNSSNQYFSKGSQWQHSTGCWSDISDIRV